MKFFQPLGFAVVWNSMIAYRQPPSRSTALGLCIAIPGESPVHNDLWCSATVELQSKAQAIDAHIVQVSVEDRNAFADTLAYIRGDEDLPQRFQACWEMLDHTTPSIATHIGFEVADCWFGDPQRFNCYYGSNVCATNELGLIDSREQGLALVEELNSKIEFEEDLFFLYEFSQIDVSASSVTRLTT